MTECALREKIEEIAAEQQGFGMRKKRSSPEPQITYGDSKVDEKEEDKEEEDDEPDSSSSSSSSSSSESDEDSFSR